MLKLSAHCRNSCLLICAAALLSGCATIRKLNQWESKTVEARRLTREAEAAVYEQDLKQAEHKLVSAIERDPTDTRARAVLADVLWEQGAEGAAIEQMSQAIELSGRRDAEQIIQLGQMQLSMGDSSGALARAEEAIKLDDNGAAAWTLKGTALKNSGNPQAALAAFFRSLSIRNDDPQTRVQIARIYQRFGQPQRALAILGAPQPEDVEGCPHFPEVCYLRGVLLRELDRPSDAIGSLRHAREAGCEANDLLFHLADAQLAAGEVLQARATLTEAAANCPPSMNSTLIRLQKQVAANLSETPPIWR